MARGVGVALATLVLLALAGPASAATPKNCNATPQRIYRDLADNGQLDRHYCASDINRALHSPTLQRYELGAERGRSPQPSHTVLPAAAGDTHGSLPFSGLDLALFGGVGGPLLLIGGSLGRLARLRAQEELS
jgi:hypothetical protein